MTVRFGVFTFHGERRQLFRQGAEVHLTPKAFDLLALLIERAPAVVAKSDIHRQLWPETFVSDATLVGSGEGATPSAGGRRPRLADQNGARSRLRVCGPGRRRRAAGGRDALGDPGTLRFALQDGVNVIGRDPDAAVWVDALECRADMRR